MISPIVRATLQSTFITFLSCLIAHYLIPSEPPHYHSLILYSALSTPFNFLWQSFIESRFPGFHLKKVSVDDRGKGVEVEKVLNVRNTVIKVVLDQTIAAVPNVVGYIGVTRFLRGVPVELCWEAVKKVGCPRCVGKSEMRLMLVVQQTIPVMVAGYKLWPAVSVVQQVFMPVDKRLLVASLVGMGWGTFLALKAAR